MTTSSRSTPSLAPAPRTIVCRRPEGSRAMTGALCVRSFSAFAASASCALCKVWKDCSRSWTFSSVSWSTFALSVPLSARRFSISAIACQNPPAVEPTWPRTRSAGTRSSVTKVAPARTKLVSRSRSRARETTKSAAKGRRKAFPEPGTRRERLADLRARDLDRPRQTGEQVAAAEERRDLFVERVRRPDRDLDVFRGPLAHQQIELATSVGNDVLVHLVAADANGSRDDDAAEGCDRDLGRAAADVDDHRTRRFVHGKSRSDRRGHRLLDESRPARAC